MGQRMHLGRATWMALAAAVVVTSHASAQSECETAADCADGFTCEVVGESGCGSVACPPDESCPPPPPCEPETILGCVPGPCETDADCGDYLECVTVTYDDCVDRLDCPPDTECDAPQEPECTTHEERLCAPPYVGACDVAADCGDGFECVDTEICTCSGGGSSGSSGSSGSGSSGSGSGSSGSGSSGDAPPPEPTPTDPADGDGDADSADGGTPQEEGPSLEEEPTCSCEPTGERHCEPIEMECTEDLECPEGWTCESGGDEAAPCAIDSEGHTDCPEPEPARSYCLPPYWTQGFGSDGGGGANDEDAFERATGAEEPQITGGGATGSGGESGPSSMGGGGGCQAAPGAGGAWVAGLALLALVRRRRR